LLLLVTGQLRAGCVGFLIGCSDHRQSLVRSRIRDHSHCELSSHICLCSIQQPNRTSPRVVKTTGSPRVSIRNMVNPYYHNICDPSRCGRLGISWHTRYLQALRLIIYRSSFL